MPLIHPIADRGIFSVYSDTEAIRLIEFFLYYAAPVSDSPLSLDLPAALSRAEKENLMSSFSSLCGCSGQDLHINCSTNESVLTGLLLTDETYQPDRPKGFLWRKNAKGSAKEEDAFDCLVRHIRNAIAHGRTCPQGNLALFEDFGTKSLTMRLLVVPNGLIDWANEMQRILDD